MGISHLAMPWGQFGVTQSPAEIKPSRSGRRRQAGPFLRALRHDGIEVAAAQVLQRAAAADQFDGAEVLGARAEVRQAQLLLQRRPRLRQELVAAGRRGVDLVARQVDALARVHLVAGEQVPADLDVVAVVRARQLRRPDLRMRQGVEEGADVRAAGAEQVGGGNGHDGLVRVYCRPILPTPAQINKLLNHSAPCEA